MGVQRAEDGRGLPADGQHDHGGSVLASQLVARIGARALLLAGSLTTTGGMFWLSRISEHSTYATGLLGPMLVTALGMGFLFVPISLVALHKVPNNDAGVASSLVNTGQQIGGSIGLALLGTVAWSAVANNVGARRRRPRPRRPERPRIR